MEIVNQVYKKDSHFASIQLLMANLLAHGRKKAAVKLTSHLKSRRKSRMVLIAGEVMMIPTVRMKKKRKLAIMKKRRKKKRKKRRKKIQSGRSSILMRLQPSI